MKLGNALKWLDEAASVGYIDMVSLTGGEPFLYEHLDKVVEHAGKLFKNIGVVTNGFWADTPEHAKQRLEPLCANGLRGIGVSCDRYHQEFLPVECVKNALEAAADLGMTTMLQSIGRNDYDFNTTLKSSFRTPLPLGRAEDLGIGYNTVPLEGLGGCPQGSLDPMVVPSGNVYICGGLALLLMKHPKAIAGNALRTPLSEILEKINSDWLAPHLPFVDWRQIIGIIDAAGLRDKLRDRYPDPCFFCAHFLSDPELYGALQEFVLS